MTMEPPSQFLNHQALTLGLLAVHLLDALLQHLHSLFIRHHCASDREVMHQAEQDDAEYRKGLGTDS